eukprot:scaffold4900_cov156-Amphora_coffeaeformis.AAC.1
MFAALETVAMERAPPCCRKQRINDARVDWGSRFDVVILGKDTSASQKTGQNGVVIAVRDGPPIKIIKTLTHAAAWHSQSKGIEFVPSIVIRVRCHWKLGGAVSDAMLARPGTKKCEASKEEKTDVNEEVKKEAV